MEIKSHYGNVHAKPASQELLQLLGESTTNRFSSSRMREAYWRELSGITYEDERHDLFDRNKVLSGGAYGLGKNRKH